MRNTRLLKGLSLALVISSLGTIAPAYAEEQGYWQQGGNNWYYKDSSTGNIKTGWIYDNGNWYYLYPDGTMVTNQWIQSGDKWYYLGSNGAMVYNTVIAGYTIGNNGYWVIGDCGALTWEDTEGTHVLRTDIAQSDDDKRATQILTKYNLDLNSDDKYTLETLSYNISKNILYLSEAKSNTLGKTIGGKYKITDIKLFNQTFKDLQGISTDARVKTVKESTVYTYSSLASNSYDSILIFSGGTTRSNEWEAIRVIVEFEVI